MKKIIIAISILIFGVGVYAQSIIRPIIQSPRGGTLFSGQYNVLTDTVYFRTSMLGEFDFWISIDTTSQIADSCLKKFPNIRVEYARINSMGKIMRDVDSLQSWFLVADSGYINQPDTVYSLNFEPKMCYGLVLKIRTNEDSTNVSTGRKFYITWGLDGQ